MKHSYEQHQQKEYLLKKLNCWYRESVIKALIKSENKKSDYSYEYRDISDLVGKRIIIYGAGKVGKGIYQQLSGEDSIELVAWVDKNLAGVKCDGYYIENPNVILGKTFDCVIIAILHEEIATEIEIELEQLSSVPKEKIIWKSGYARVMQGEDLYIKIMGE